MKVAVKTTRSFLRQHLKTSDVKLGKFLNLKLHEHGRKQPPHHTQVKVWKEKEVYHAELVGAPIEKPVEEQKEKKTAVPQEPKPESIPKEEATRETLEKEKKEVLKHPDKHKVKHEPLEVKRKVKGAQKAGEMQHKKEVFSKTQKPAHEKKKG